MDYTIKCYYDKTLKMSVGKVAAQVGHAVAKVVECYGHMPPHKIIVLEANHGKFVKMCEDQTLESYIQYDLGLTEVEPSTPTVIAILEDI